MDNNIQFSALLERGFLSEKLPRPFASISLGKIAAKLDSFDEFLATPTQSVKYNHTRYNDGCRVYHTPNPISYAQLVREIANGWNEIQEIFTTKNNSRTKPVADQKFERAYISEDTWEEKRLFKAKVRSSSRFLLKADLAKFYPSIYSHSIAWALHGKSEAKKLRSSSKLIGNRIDKALRNCQDGQTKGIPIGPDTSLILAELIMSSVDLDLKEYSSGYFRAIDDIEFCDYSKERIDHFFGDLQRSIQKWELSLNDKKTSFVELPQPIEEPFISSAKLWSLIKVDDPKSQRDWLLSSFSSAIESKKKDPNSPVIQFWIRGNSTRRKIYPLNWDLYQNLLENIVLNEVGVIDAVVDEIFAYSESGYPLAIDRWADTFNKILLRGIRRGSGSEIAYAAWALIEMKSLSVGIAQKILTLDDPIAKCIVLLGAFRKVVDREIIDFREAISDEEFFGNQWIFYYQAAIWKFKNIKRGIDAKAIRMMTKLNISFVDDRLHPYYKKHYLFKPENQQEKPLDLPSSSESG